MPFRTEPLINDEIYHIVNRGVASMVIFPDDRHYQRALETTLYYQNKKISLRYSYFSRLTTSEKKELLSKLEKLNQPQVEIICYCLMPTHVHFLLKQVVDNGVTNFMRKFTSSYSHYFNIKNKRFGPLFQGRFKAVRIESEQQLLHVSRYIHLNPYSSGLVKKIADLKNYFHSSLPEYLGLVKDNICQKDDVLSCFKKPGSYQDFIFGQADYQRELEILKHVMLENPEID